MNIYTLFLENKIYIFYRRKKYHNFKNRTQQYDSLLFVNSTLLGTDVSKYTMVYKLTLHRTFVE